MSEGIGIRRGQRTAVELTVGREREGIELYEGGRHHVVGQAAARYARSSARSAVDLGHQRDIGDEALVGIDARTREHHGFTHRRMFGELCLDLTALDPEAANLDLMVITAEEHEIAIRQIAGEVAGAIHARARDTANGSSRNRSAVSSAPVQIPARNTRATDVQFTDRPQRHRLTPRIEQIQPRIGERLADDGLHLASRDFRDGRIHRALGRTIDVESAICAACARRLQVGAVSGSPPTSTVKGRLPLFEQTGARTAISS